MAKSLGKAALKRRLHSGRPSLASNLSPGKKGGKKGFYWCQSQWSARGAGPAAPLGWAPALRPLAELRWRRRGGCRARAGGRERGRGVKCLVPNHAGLLRKTLALFLHSGEAEGFPSTPASCHVRPHYPECRGEALHDLSGNPDQLPRLYAGRHVQRQDAHQEGQPGKLLHRPRWQSVPLHPQLPADLPPGPARGLPGDGPAAQGGRLLPGAAPHRGPAGEGGGDVQGGEERHAQHHAEAARADGALHRAGGAPDLQPVLLQHGGVQRQHLQHVLPLPQAPGLQALLLLQRQSFLHRQPLAGPQPPDSGLGGQRGGPAGGRVHQAEPEAPLGGARQQADQQLPGVCGRGAEDCPERWLLHRLLPPTRSGFYEQ